MSSTCRNSRSGRPVPQITTSSRAASHRLVKTADQGGQDMGVLGVEVVARAVRLVGITER